MRVCQGERIMKHIKKITATEMNEALERYYDVARKEEFWEVKGLYALDNYLCFATLDNNCYMCFNPDTNNYVFFAFEHPLTSNLVGMFESFYELICAGFPVVRVEGGTGRYIKILRRHGHYNTAPTTIDGHEAYFWYIGHPDIIKIIERWSR